MRPVYGLQNSMPVLGIALGVGEFLLVLCLIPWFSGLGFLAYFRWLFGKDV